MPRATRTVKDRPLRIPVSLHDVYECASLTRDFTDPLDDARTCEATPSQEARHYADNKPSEALHDFNNPRSNPERDPCLPGPSYFDRHSDTPKSGTSNFL